MAPGANHNQQRTIRPPDRLTFILNPSTKEVLVQQFWSHYEKSQTWNKGLVPD